MSEKRKSGSRRSLRFSRASIVSNALNADSIISNEDNGERVWWKDLDDNSVAVRPSMRFSGMEYEENVLQLESEPEMSTALEGWWDNLDTSKASPHKSFRRSRPSSVTLALTTRNDDLEVSEATLEEDNILKKRPALHYKTRRKSLGTQLFQKALDSSNDSLDSEMISVSKKKQSHQNTTDNPLSSDHDSVMRKDRLLRFQKTDTNKTVSTVPKTGARKNSEVIHGSQNTKRSSQDAENNLEESAGEDSVHKKRPALHFKRQHKSHGERLFIDALESSENSIESESESEIIAPKISDNTNEHEQNISDEAQRQHDRLTDENRVLPFEKTDKNKTLADVDSMGVNGASQVMRDAVNVNPEKNVTQQKEDPKKDDGLTKTPEKKKSNTLNLLSVDHSYIDEKKLTRHRNSREQSTKQNFLEAGNSDYEVSEVSAEDESIRKRRPALHFTRKRKSHGEGLFVDALESSEISIETEKFSEPNMPKQSQRAKSEEAQRLHDSPTKKNRVLSFERTADSIILTVAGTSGVKRASNVIQDENSEVIRGLQNTKRGSQDAGKNSEESTGEDSVRKKRPALHFKRKRKSHGERLFIDALESSENSIESESQAEIIAPKISDNTNEHEQNVSAAPQRQHDRLTNENRALSFEKRDKSKTLAVVDSMGVNRASQVLRGDVNVNPRKNVTQQNEDPRKDDDLTKTPEKKKSNTLNHSSVDHLCIDGKNLTRHRDSREQSTTQNFPQAGNNYYEASEVSAEDESIHKRRPALHFTRQRKSHGEGLFVDALESSEISIETEKFSEPNMPKQSQHDMSDEPQKHHDSPIKKSRVLPFEKIDKSLRAAVAGTSGVKRASYVIQDFSDVDVGENVTEQNEAPSQYNDLTPPRKNKKQNLSRPWSVSTVNQQTENVNRSDRFIGEPRNTQSTSKLFTNEQKSISKNRSMHVPNKPANESHEVFEKSPATNIPNTDKNRRNSNNATQITKQSTVDTRRGEMTFDKRPVFLSERVAVDEEKMTKIKKYLEELKKEEQVSIENAKIDPFLKRLQTAKQKVGGASTKPPSLQRKMQKNNPPKPVNKAYIVNGRVYKTPKLPKPKDWVNNRLYNYLWKCMEPKYGHKTRVRSETFVMELCEAVALITRRKKFDNYKSELIALQKDMARLGIIKTRSDFYIFCQEFLPYSFRVKVVPILQPGNVENIPYDPETLHSPILET